MSLCRGADAALDKGVLACFLATMRGIQLFCRDAPKLRWWSCALILLTWLAGVGDVWADKAGDDRQRGTGASPVEPVLALDSQAMYQSQVLLGSALAVFWHEFGHALIGETRVPATGPEEDVADGFASFILSAAVDRPGMSAAEQEFTAGIVRYSALLWYYGARERAASGSQISWESEHGWDLKRFRNAFCIIYGASPKRFESLARQVGLSERTRKRCRAERRKRRRAWETILRTVSRDFGPSDWGAHPVDAPGGRIVLDFGPTQSPAGRALGPLLARSGILDGAMAEMERRIVWPRDLRIGFRDCHLSNAWYDGRRGEITICYGLIEKLSELIYRAEGRSWDG